MRQGGGMEDLIDTKSTPEFHSILGGLFDSFKLALWPPIKDCSFNPYHHIWLQWNGY